MDARPLFFVFALTLLPSGAHAKGLPEATQFSKLARKHTAGYEACVLLRDLKSGKTLSFGGEARCEKRTAPCSTFKLPHAMIALESGVLRDATHTLPWDKRKKPFKAWQRDHDLQSAFRYSVLWYFQQVALRISQARMQKHLARLEYGNRRIGPSLMRFWIDGSLRIAPDEQLRLLTAFYKGKLGYSARTTRIAKALMEAADPRPDFGGKTGTCRGKEDVGWFIGHRRYAGRDYVLVTRMIGKGASGRQSRRKSKVLLRAVGLL